MRINRAIALSAGMISLLSSPLQVMAAGLQLGPIDLRFDARGSQYRVFPYFQNPVCYAISQRKLLEIVLEVVDSKTDNEKKITRKKITIEPYLFGRDANGDPIVKGNVIADIVLKEITIKYPSGDKDGEQKQYKSEKAPSSPQEGKKDGIMTVGASDVVEFHVIQQSHFDIPKNYKDMYKDVTEVICTVIPTERERNMNYRSDDENQGFNDWQESQEDSDTKLG